jgi:phosphoserine phosphatase RsbU/P
LRARKIAIIMKKNKTRDNILISLQKAGYRAYVVPEDRDMKETLLNMEAELVVFGETEKIHGRSQIEYLRDIRSIVKLPIIVTVDKTVENSDIVMILKAGATDIVYVKDENIMPVITIVDRFMGEVRGDFELKHFKVEEEVILQMKGELDITNSFKVQSAFNRILETGEKHFIIDISLIEYIESVGLGTLIHIKKNVDEKGGKVRFIIKSAKIKKLLSMVNLDKYFEIYDDLEELIALPEAERRIKVAIIDDAKFMRKVLKDILEKEGFDVLEFESATKALTDIPKIGIDAVLVDYEMPDMDGLEFIDKFKPQVREIPTVMLTTDTNVNVALRAIRMGASDFLNKPVKSDELIYIIKKIVKSNNLKKENQRLFLELKRREKELEKKNIQISKLYNDLEDELQMASEIQKKLMPETFPEVDGFKFAVKYLPSQDIGGDFYDMVKMSNGYYGVAFADVSGHGIPAALLSTMFKVYLMTYSEDIISPAETMELLNDVVVETFPEGKFISIFYLVIYPGDNKVRYCKAAQEPGVLVRKNGEIRELITAGQVLGLFSEEDFPGILDFKDGEVELDSGDKIFLYTDGIVEALNKKEEFYGMERLKQVLYDNKDAGAQELIDIVYGDLMDFIEGLPIHDDLTLLVIEKT